MNARALPRPQIPVNSADPRHAVTLTVNGVEVSREVSPRMLLSDFIRHELGLTGTHVGCEHGVCGACTVLIDGVSARSCLTLAVQADGAELRTVEALADGDAGLSVLQQAFAESHALQCGYCTPGFLMALTEQFESDAPLDLSDEGIRDMIAGNLCRCTGYAGIVAAVRRAAELSGRG